MYGLVIRGQDSRAIYQLVNRASNVPPVSLAADDDENGTS